MHFMDMVGGRDAFRERNVAAGGQVVPGPHNPQVERQIIAWIRACLARPPVRTMALPASLAGRVEIANATHQPTSTSASVVQGPPVLNSTRSR